MFHLTRVSTGVPSAALDVVSTGTLTNIYAQIWRDSNGAVKSSMSATGVMMATKFIGDGSGITNFTGTGQFQFTSLTSATGKRRRCGLQLNHSPKSSYTQMTTKMAWWCSPTIQMCTAAGGGSMPYAPNAGA